MALEYIKQINENIHLAVWKINEDMEYYERNTQLSSVDQAIVKKTTHTEKKIEFLAGRMLSQVVLQRLDISDKLIFRNQYGKPEIPNSEYSISLSHTERYIALAIGYRLDIGIDIEKPKAKMAKIAPRVLTEVEMEYCQGKLDYFSKMWSAKEVLYKLFMKRNLNFREHLHLKPENEEWTLMTGTIKKDRFIKVYQIIFCELGEYFIGMNVN